MKTLSITCAIGVIILATMCSISIILSQETETENSPDLVIIDTDAGSDDAVALFYLLRAEKYSAEENNGKGIKILGITCVLGNTILDNVVQNVLKVLNTVGRLDIPVFRGADKSLTIDAPRSYYFGDDGMGDVPSTFVPDPSLVKKEHAVTALLRLVNENPGKITLLVLGPLTNVALAARLNGNFLNKLKKLVILGGSVSGRGNMNPGVEFNFSVDPEAVHIIFNGTDTNPNSISLVAWETILTVNITVEWRKTVLGALKSPEIKFINAIEHMDTKADGMWQPADPMAAAVFLAQEAIVGRMESYGITAIMSGPTRGGIAVDYKNTLDSETKADIVYDINTEVFKESLINHFS